MLIELPAIFHWKISKHSKKGGIPGAKFGPSSAPDYEKDKKLTLSLLFFIFWMSNAGKIVKQ